MAAGWGRVEGWEAVTVALRLVGVRVRWWS
jgi:hypothetical protein